jgi:hypothetical protein
MHTNRQLENPKERSIWEKNIKMYPRGIGYDNADGLKWLRMGAQMQTPVSMAMNLHVT